MSSTLGAGQVGAQSEALFFDLSARVKLRLTGTDRFRFLNGQITNDANKASASQAISASILNARGKLEAQIFLWQDADNFFADADPELREILQPRLERYVIADNIEMAEVSQDYALFHIAAAERPALPAFCQMVKSNRFGIEGWDVWVSMSRHDEIFNQLAGTHSFCDDAGLEVYRVERGVPRWGNELTNEIIPVEANLEESSINYEKGCYIGQEVISRMKMSGQRSKKLCGFVSLSGAPLEPGMKVYPLGEEKSKEAGWLTSTVHSKQLGKEIALGYIKRPFYHATYRLDAVVPDSVGAPVVRVEIADLPFIASGPQK